MTKLDAALALAARGFKTFPLTAWAKAPPLVADWPNKAAADALGVQRLFADCLGANIAIHCAGMLVLDVDVKSGGDATLTLLADTFSLDLRTLTTRTPSGGRHLFYSLPEGHPGVANTVAKLGPGLDTRSTGGYVVAPGSETPRGKYTFEADVPILPAPQWLIDMVGVAGEAKRHDVSEIPDAEPSAVERAAAWLVKHEGAVQGQGGDLHTFKTAARLRDYGVSAGQARELMEGWNETCAPPWGLDELWTKVQNAYRFAQDDEPGKLAVTDNDFAAPVYSGPDLVTQGVDSAPKANQSVNTSAETPTKRHNNGGPQPLSAFASGEAGARYLVKGVLTEGAYAVMYGVRSAGKTFAAMDIAYHVAAGREWLGHRVRQASVLYLPYEGAGGLKKRAEALRRHYGTAEVPFYVDAGRYNLREPEGRKGLAEAIAKMPEVPRLIIIDTFAHALCGGDENSAQDVGAFNSAVQGLIQRTGACVMVLHHPAKSGNGGPRGSGALPGAVDIELEVTHEGASRRIQATKQRDFELGDAIGFKLEPIAVGVDEDGDEISSCVVMGSSIAPYSPAAKLKGVTKLVWDKLCEMSPSNEPVLLDELHHACAEFVPKRRASWFEIRSRLRPLTHQTETHMQRKLQ